MVAKVAGSDEGPSATHQRHQQTARLFPLPIGALSKGRRISWLTLDHSVWWFSPLNNAFHFQANPQNLVD